MLDACVNVFVFDRGFLFFFMVVRLKLKILNLIVCSPSGELFVDF